MPHNVFYHDNRIVDQNANREDESEQRNAIQRVPIQIEDRQGQRQGHRDSDKHDERLPKAQRNRNQNAYRDHGNQHVFEKLVGLLLRRVAVVARDGHFDVGWKHVPLECPYAREHVVGDRHGVGPLAF